MITEILSRRVRTSEGSTAIKVDEIHVSSDSWDYSDLEDVRYQVELRKSAALFKQLGYFYAGTIGILVSENRIDTLINNLNGNNLLTAAFTMVGTGVFFKLCADQSDVKKGAKEHLKSIEDTIAASKPSENSTPPVAN